MILVAGFVEQPGKGDDMRRVQANQPKTQILCSRQRPEHQHQRKRSQGQVGFHEATLPPRRPPEARVKFLAESAFSRMSPGWAARRLAAPEYCRQAAVAPVVENKCPTG